MKSIYCVVVTYNGKKWVDKCFGSLRLADYPIKTIVVDNGSTDGTQEKIRQKFPEVELIQSKENLGFGKANNIGIEKALEEGAEFVFLLNQDAYLFKGSIKNLISKLEENSTVGIASPIHLAGDEKNLDKNFSNYLNPKNTPQILGDMVLGKLKCSYESKFINAAAWFIKASLFKEIGLFNPAFDHYAEDNEFVFRMHKANFKLIVFPQTSIVHDRPQDGKSSSRRHVKSNRFKQDMLLMYFTNKYSMHQINLEYLKMIVINITSGNFKRAIDHFYCLIDIRNKVKKQYKRIL